MTFKAAIFDMDGLLLDTERVCMKAFEKACHTLGLEFLKPEYLAIIGQNAQGVERTIRAGYPDDLDYPALRKVWMEYYHDVTHHQAIPIKEGVLELLDWLKGNNIPIAVATSTELSLAKTKLKLAGLESYFDVLACGCEVTHGKPDPEIYLLAASRLNIDPKQCLGFEDSNNGVRSGVAANLQMYQVPDLVSPTDEIVALGHQILPSMLDVLQHLKQAG
ncbi:phosphatase [Vibrio breoganii]|uniref:HAD family hydrolase n=1 Tax=Vibrio breoganii TaxID=553239 RepID=UPI0002ED99E3|nr:HAD family phosphatase [Vibrio breoganii]OED93960.1 phosphatase [Vibrio breoganii ZF-29]OEF83079.1 phosphatase [Vibrio breoganii 1C10]PMG38700.1 phosphatase [Vibrio breoganii]PML37541.1 phosphatase [Vibrio breoganii]PMO70033.1 phosphatase [Vibrio breoganii]